MLTSSHYWFGGIIAVSCAVGGLVQPASASLNLPQASFKAAISESIDVAYRGSGRLKGISPAQGKDYRSRSSYQKNLASHNLASHNLASHRGSGRIQSFRS